MNASNDPVQQRARAIDGFAARLRDLRTAAGDPSFREMQRRSGAISHTTLHDAVRGTRLPSWATTAEFVKACGRDPAAFREQWAVADREVRAAEAAIELADADHATPADEASDEDIPQESAAPEESAALQESVVSEGPVVPDDSAPDARGPWFLRWQVAAAVVVVIGIAIAAVVLLLPEAEGEGESPQRQAGDEKTAADCPVQQTDPAPAPPVHKGDKVVFITDVTLPDCVTVEPATSVEKVWRFKNAGSVPWKNYVLRRVDIPQESDDCQTIQDIPVPDTEPGKTVDVTTMVTTPRESTFCFVRFKMADAQGKFAYPGSRPVTFQLIVD